ncbi:MAG: hypothetical protein IPL39_03020 [Opitutaceae bacterium]|nr:hypothetical protein [Opitutaceae bacterium]
MSFSPKLARFARRTLLTLAVLATLTVGLIVEENWRGERAWREYAARQAALGDPVDVFPAPSTLPPERNFMKTPLLDRLLFAKDGSAELKEFGITLSSPEVPVGAIQVWRTGRMTDLAAVAGTTAAQGADTTALQTAYLAGADSVLAAHAQAGSSAILEELRRAAAARPESQIVHRVAISETSLLDFPLPNFPTVRRLMNALALDASAALARDRAVEAWGDVMAMVQLTRGFSDTPDITLVETMVGTVLVNSVAQPVWEAEVRRSWTDSQWAGLQQELATIAPLSSLERCLRIERVHAAGLLQNTGEETSFG